MIRAIFFDLDGTLIDRAPLWLRCVDDFMSRHHLTFPAETRGAFLADLTGVTDSPFLDRFLVARVVARMFPGLGLSADAISADLAVRLPQFVEPDPAVLRLVRDLSGRYSTAVVTNGSRRVQRPKLERAGLASAVGPVLISGEVGLRKPDPALFRLALRRAGVAPEDALFVGDHPYEDILGAQRAGLLTCAVGTRYFDYWPEPDWKIDRVVDLPGVLG